MRSIRYVIVISSLVFAGCAATQTRPAKTKNADLKDRLSRLENLVEKKEQRISALREENLILKTRKTGSIEGVNVFGEKFASRGPLRPSTKLPSKKRSLEMQMSKMTEMQLYSEAMNSYQLGQREKLSVISSVFIKKYPQSIYADDVLYLSGLISLVQGKFALALKDFNQIINEYPRGNKRRQALFAKARSYRNMNLKSQAYRTFEMVSAQYPGSAESQKAKIEMGLLKTANSSM